VCEGFANPSQHPTDALANADADCAVLARLTDGNLSLHTPRSMRQTGAELLILCKGHVTVLSQPRSALDLTDCPLDIPFCIAKVTCHVSLSSVVAAPAPRCGAAARDSEPLGAGRGKGEDPVAKAERAKGIVALNLGRYEEAIEHLSQAYTLTRIQLCFSAWARLTDWLASRTRRWLHTAHSPCGWFDAQVPNAVGASYGRDRGNYLYLVPAQSAGGATASGKATGQFDERAGSGRG